MMCFTEQQKQEIVHKGGMLVIEFKQLLIRSCEALKEIFEAAKGVLLKIAERICRDVQAIYREYQKLPSKEKYKAVRRLDKCGFTEKEINLMAGGAYHCRNNC